MNIIIVIGLALLAFVVVVAIFYVIARVLGGPDGSIEDRLDQFVSREVEERPTDDQAERAPSVFTRSIDEAVAGRGFAQNISTQLARADLRLTPGEYIILTITIEVPYGRSRSSVCYLVRNELNHIKVIVVVFNVAEINP